MGKTYKSKSDGSAEDYLSAIVECMPGNLYWKSKDGRYLGSNKALLDVLGFSREAFVGKRDSDLWPDHAEELLKHDRVVMQLGKSVSFEESVFLKKNETKYYIAVKTPMKNMRGEIIGIIGNSIDITAKKRTEELEHQNRLQKIELLKQEEFQHFMLRMAHDINSPLASLRSFVDRCTGLTEKQHTTLRSIVSSINNIASDLLIKYEENRQQIDSSQERDILVSLALQEIVSQKREQYSGQNIRFNYSFDPKIKFAFIKGDKLNFNRMISNLINNAVESFENAEGTVEIPLTVEDKLVKIGINDNGKGMPQDMVEKILNNVSVGTTKLNGHGIGLGQIRNTLEIYGGKMYIESKEKVGTKISIVFPISPPPNWVTDRVVLRKGSIVVVLDDDPSIYEAWKILLKDYSNDLTIKFFTNGCDTLKFIDSSFEQSKIFLLSDYDLRSNMTGLQVILESGMKKQALLVTSIHNDKAMQNLIESSGLKVLPKQFLSDIKIIVE